MFCQRLASCLPWWPVPGADACATPPIYYAHSDCGDSYASSYCGNGGVQCKGSWLSRLFHAIGHTLCSWGRQILGFKEVQDPTTMGLPSNGHIMDDCGIFSADLTDFRIGVPEGAACHRNPFLADCGPLSARPAGEDLFI